MIAIFCHMLVFGAYIWRVHTVVSSIMRICALSQCALFHSACDLKVALMNVQHCLIRELTFYEFEEGQNAVKPTKNICNPKDKITANHSTVTRELKI